MKRKLVHSMDGRKQNIQPLNKLGKQESTIGLSLSLSPSSQLAFKQLIGFSLVVSLVGLDEDRSD